MLFGFGSLMGGWFWDFAFPINKQLWTSSYVLYSAGWSLLILAFCYELSEIRGVRRWGLPFEVMGLNAIFVFVASGFIVRILYRTTIVNGEESLSTYAWIYENWFVPWAGYLNGSLVFAITNILFWWLISYFMYRKSIFFKV